MANGSFYMMPAYAESVSAVTATPSVQLGARRMESGEEYCYVYNAGGEQIPPGYGCILSAVTGYSVTVSSLTQVGGFFGVVKNATLTTGTYGWVVVKGFVPMKNGMASTAMSAGDQVIPALNGAWAAHTATVNGVIQGFVVQATGAAGTAYGYVKCFG